MLGMKQLCIEYAVPKRHTTPGGEQGKVQDIS